MFIVCSIYLCVLGVLALCSNLAIFFLYIRVKAVTAAATTCDSVQDNLQHRSLQLRTTFNMMLMNLLVGELLVTVFGIPVDFWASAR